MRLHWKVLRHSTAHVMATAILELFRRPSWGMGPATESGFFYDVYRETPFTEADLAAIEAGWRRWSRAMRNLCAWRSRAKRG